MAFFDDIFADLTQSNEFEDLPQLDFDSSTLTSSAPSLDPALAAPPLGEGLPMDLTVEPFVYDSQVPVYKQPDTDSDEIKQMLTALSSRLTDLELAVSTGNAQLNQLGFSIDIAMPKILGIADEFRYAVDSLRDSLKNFARGLINHLLNCRIEGDIETGGNT